MMRSKNWTKSTYYGQTPKEIKAGWEENRVAAANAGTKRCTTILNVSIII